MVAPRTRVWLPELFFKRICYVPIYFVQLDGILEYIRSSGTRLTNNQYISVICINNFNIIFVITRNLNYKCTINSINYNLLFHIVSFLLSLSLSISVHDLYRFHQPATRANQRFYWLFCVFGSFARAWQISIYSGYCQLGSGDILT